MACSVWVDVFDSLFRVAKLREEENMNRAEVAYTAYHKHFDKGPSRKWDDEEDSVKQIWADVANAAIGVQDDSYFDYIIAQIKNRNLSENDVAAIIVTRLEKTSSRYYPATLTL